MHPLHLLTITERFNKNRITYQQADTLLRACFAEQDQARAAQISIKLLDDPPPYASAAVDVELIGKQWRALKKKTKETDAQS